MIGMLSALLLPVLSQQTEAARTKSCLSNQQRIVAAIRMYLADHDNTFPPKEHRQEVLDYFWMGPGGGWWSFDPDEDCPRATQANPYLRWPVVFDPYLPGREVWSCPSAVLSGGATFIVPQSPSGWDEDTCHDWLHYWMQNEGMWGDYSELRAGPCSYAWPLGWGGDVTDSLVQGRLAVPKLTPYRGTVAVGAFQQSIATTYWPEMTLQEVASPDRFIITADGGVTTQQISVGTMAYPEICALECGNCGGSADWEICADQAADCGLYHYAPNDGSFLLNPSLRLPYARHRATGASAAPPWSRNGVNIGFLDGHAEWIASEKLVASARDSGITGVEFWGPPTWCSSPQEWIANSGGQPTLW
jgi:prepilin-type processing-associated H-X9-DG protein